MRRVPLLLAAVLALLVCAGGAAPAFAPSAAARQADNFLKRRGSPLAGLGKLSVQLGVSCARPYDGRLLLAITGAETAFAKQWGRFQPSSHNAWSWITGTNRYDTYKGAMRVVARGICANYIRHGLITIRQIGPRYVLGQREDHGRTDGWENTVRWSLHQMGGASVLLPRNPPTRQPKPVGRTAPGRTVSKDCARKTLVHNDRGRCVRSVQHLLRGLDPAYRPSHARRKHQAGANVDRAYWRVRKAKPSGVYGKATILAVQKVKYRLGFAPKRANGAAGPKLRAYLLGRPLPASYVNAKEHRYATWKGQHSAGGSVKAMMADAAYLLANTGRIHYTQTMTGSHGRLSMLTYHPRGPPLGPGDLYGDCSGTVEALYIWNGLPDPSGPGAWQSYPGAPVYTGSQAARGTRVWRLGESLSRLQQGDLVFYGGPFGGSHVAMYIGNGRVFSHGSESCPCNNSVLYRDDAYEARRYR